MFIDMLSMGKPPNGEAKTVIWVVDRDPDLLQFLEACLVRSLGSEVRALRSGGAALAALTRTRPDVLLCELDLPGASGEDVAGAAGQLPRPPSIVLMSGDADRLQRARHRADRLLPKPFPLSELVWSVGTLIAKGANA